MSCLSVLNVRDCCTNQNVSATGELDVMLVPLMVSVQFSIIIVRPPDFQ